MPKRNIAALAILTLTLGGCSTLQKLNPFKHKVKTAPCHSIVSVGPTTTICEGKTINIDAPSVEELMQLRGPIDPDTGRSIGIILAAP